jgi:hypothetical protein
MARSTYIYLVTGPLRIPVAGFTVKHELQTWLERNPGEYELWRLSDGGSREPTTFEVDS